MLNKIAIPSLLAASALALVSVQANAEGKGDRAQQAIAAAQAKVDVAKSMGGSTELPHGVAEADAALNTAKEEASAGNKEEAIHDAIHAQSLADTSIGEMQKRKDAAMADQQQAAAAQNEAAQQQVAAAQNQAADANARAGAAEQSAAQSAQAAQTAADAANRPAQVQTTVTTHESSHPKVATKKVVTKHTTTTVPQSTSNDSTTTTVSSSMN
jgi:hypothetical protein